MKTGSVLDESKYILINIIAITGVERITANGDAINSLKKLFFPPAIPKMEPRKKEIKNEQTTKIVKNEQGLLRTTFNGLAKLFKK